MDLLWGDERRNAFVSNVGLITSKDEDKNFNIMSAEWTFQLAYSPTRFGVSIGKGKLTEKNISSTRIFGISIASEKQNVIASLSGNNHGDSLDKIEVLKELGFEFIEGKETGILLVKDAVLQLECKLVERIDLGSHILFIGEVVSSSELNKKVDLLVYNSKTFYKVGEKINKPIDEELAKIEEAVNNHKR